MDGLAGRPYLASGLCFASEDIFRGIPDSHAGQESFTLYERYYTALPQLKSEHIEQMGSLFSANIGITVLVRDAQKINSPRSKNGPLDRFCPPERAAGTSYSIPVRRPKPHGYKEKHPAPLRAGCLGDPYGNRTHVTAVKGPCLNRLTNGPL